MHLVGGVRITDPISPNNEHSLESVSIEEPDADAAMSAATRSLPEMVSAAALLALGSML